MAEFLVDQIEVNEADSTGCKILTIYAKVSGKYAVYRTTERVMVQWADSGTSGEDGQSLGPRQRDALALLACPRGEINGLIDGWRDTPPAWKFWQSGNASRAKRYDRLVADALVMGLTGDPTHGLQRLMAIKAAIIDERTGLGRVQYVLAAFILGIVAILVGTWFGSSYAHDSSRLGWDAFVPQRWMAAAFGVLGAYLSLALQIRSRDVRLDLQTSNNVIDAGLRICVGALSAVVLAAFLQAKLLTLSFNGTTITGENGSVTMELLIVASVAAGFTERLVGDVIAQAVAKLPGGGTAPAAVTAGPPISAPVHGGEDDPAGRIAKVTASVPAAAATAATSPLADDAVDGCLAGHADDDDPTAATQDVELPEAIGGVETK